MLAILSNHPVKPINKCKNACCKIVQKEYFFVLFDTIERELLQEVPVQYFNPGFHKTQGARFNHQNWSANTTKPEKMKDEEWSLEDLNSTTSENNSHNVSNGQWSVFDDGIE